jgi:hypothetical protein
LVKFKQKEEEEEEEEKSNQLFGIIFRQAKIHKKQNIKWIPQLATLLLLNRPLLIILIIEM